MDEESRRRKDEAEQSSQFRVEDRRRFDPATGEARVEQDALPLPGGGVLQGAAAPDDARPPVDFGELVQPFLLIGLAGLGVVPHPNSHQPEVNLRAARAAIESLELLRAKTEGNRAPEETRLLDEALYELKMQFVEARERSRRG